LLKKVYLMGKTGSGKTAIALGLALIWKEKGLKVAYFKPKTAGQNLPPNQDTDVSILKKVLDLPWTPEQIAPVKTESTYIFGQSDYNSISVEKMERKLEDSFREISDVSQVMIIEGGKSPYACFSILLDDFSLAKKWEVPVIYISNLDKDDDLDELLFYNNYIQSRGLFLLGNILNGVSPEKLDRTRNFFQPFMEEKGYKLLGLIPTNPAISFPTVAEFHETLQGELLAGEENLGRPVEDIVVGTMTIEGALRYLRRALNKAVITGGDRSDLALTAMETSTSVLILTGGLYPDIRVISQAREKGVPVILVNYDTYTTIGMLQGIVRQIRSDDTKTTALIRDEIAKCCQWEKIESEMESYRIYSGTKVQ